LSLSQSSRCAKDILERNKKARTVHCRRCNRTCDRDEMAVLNMGAVFWSTCDIPKHLDAEYAYRHGTNWDPPEWSSSNKRMPAYLVLLTTVADSSKRRESRRR
jgi:hypothetical protein